MKCSAFFTARFAITISIGVKVCVTGISSGAILFNNDGFLKTQNFVGEAIAFNFYLGKRTIHNKDKMIAIIFLGNINYLGTAKQLPIFLSKRGYGNQNDDKKGNSFHEQVVSIDEEGEKIRNKKS